MVATIVVAQTLTTGALAQGEASIKDKPTVLETLQNEMAERQAGKEAEFAAARASRLVVAEWQGKLSRATEEVQARIHHKCR
jgi:hypothetical protein